MPRSNPSCAGRRMPRPIALAIALVLLTAFAACSPRESNAPANVLRIGTGAEPKSLDPHIVTGVAEDRILSALFEGLVNLDFETLEPIPGVAESWEISDDGTVYTFHLRENAIWSNGDPVSAQDFVYAWRRLLTPELGAEYAYMAYPIANAEAFNRGQITDPETLGVRARDNRTLEVTLRAPTPYFFALHVHFSFYPVNRAAVEAYGALHERDTKWTRPGNLVSNGPYTLAEWRPNDVIVARKNPRYWGAHTVSIEEIRFYPIQNPSVEERSFRAGQLDITNAVPVTKIPVYRRENPDLIRIDPYIGTEFIRFNMTRAPFDDRRVRRAFAMSIDRETLVQRVLQGGQIAAEHFTPPDTAGYTAAARIPYDPEAARALLAEAGYPGGKNFPHVELLYDSGDNQRIYCEALQQMWEETLDVRVAIVNQDVKTWLANMIGLNYDLARSYWIGDYVDASNFLDMFYSTSGNNRTGFSSPEYESHLRAAGTARDREERLAHFQEAEHILLDEAAIAPVYFWTRVYLASPRVKGLQPNLLGKIDYRRLRMAVD